jgi:hypothetical protein
MMQMSPSNFEHEVRNASLGVALEIRQIVEALGRMENHLKRMKVACEASLLLFDDTKKEK